MRMRKKKNLEPRMDACAAWQEKSPADWKGRWKDKVRQRCGWSWAAARAVLR